MAKALITLQGGATVAIEGSQDEVAALLARFNGDEQGGSRSSRQLGDRHAKTAKTTPMGLLLEMIAAGFFGEPKELSAVRLALQEQGHFYPVTTLSPLMLRLVRRKELRRIKDKKRWTYVR